jgi:SAM-dependent methyltransferase
MTGQGSPPVAPDRIFTDRTGAAWVAFQEQSDAQLAPLGRTAMARLDLGAGGRVVDVGCGCGDTLIELASRVGPDGHVLGVDISEPMLARARERAAALPQVAVCLADAQTYPFAPASADAVYSRFGVMFFDDPRAAFANLRAALRPNGQLAFVCWQERSRNAWADVPLRAVLAQLPEAPPPAVLQPGAPGPFAFADPAWVRGLLSGAGFRAVAIEPVETTVHVGAATTLAEGLAYCRNIGPASRAMAEAAPARRPQLEAALEEALGPFVSARGLWMDAAAFIVTARS